MLSLRSLRQHWQFARCTIQDSLSCTSERLPFPPPRLRHRVNGDPSLSSFASQGKRISNNLIRLFERAGRQTTDFQSLLDFGCGCGRTLRYLHEALPKTRLSGAEVDPDAVKWCRGNLPDMTFALNQAAPPMSFGDDSFDAVIAVSVFTHLPEGLQDQWLRELSRVSASGATLVISVYNPDYAHRRLTPPDSASLDAKGFFYHSDPLGRSGTQGLPDYYQMSFHTPDYVHEHWSEFFDVVEYVEHGIGPIQDAVLLRAR